MFELQPGDFINHRYRVVRCLGKGAMGTVYLVEDIIKVHRLVALKILNSENLDDPDLWSKGEYEALTRLRHPNLARVYDFGRVQESDDFYIVSEFIRGQDLFTATRDVPGEEILDILAQICRALDFIHMQGYVHFDVKPDNILVTRDKQVGDEEGSKVLWNPDALPGSEAGKGPPRAKLIDFGLAEKITGSFDFAIKGTFNFVAPEIIRGRTPDRRADLYSLGVTMFKVLTGKVPFVGEDGRVYSRSEINWQEELRRDLDGQPDFLVEILTRLLEEDPDKRYTSAREIIQAINAGANQRYQLETAETQVSYLYSSRLVGRQKELNQLKEEAETIFPQQLLVHQARDGGAPATAAEVEKEVKSGGTTMMSRLLRTEKKKRIPLFLLSGEIGIGKSRLFEEFTHFLKMRETPVHVGNCYETCQDAYQPFRELISQAALSLGLDSEVFQTYRASLQKLCPGLRSSAEGSDPETGFRPDKERLYFIDQLAHFVIDMALVGPCVIAINNLHWADEASVEVLAYLVEELVHADEESPFGLPLMLAVTMRSDENLNPSLKNLLTRMREDERVREIPLRRFSRTQIAELIHNMLHLEEIPTPFLDRLEERTSGNPLFIAETLKTLQEEGILAREGEEWKIKASDLSRIEIPHGLEAILLRRFRMLDPNLQRLLEALAVYDKPMSGKLLERLPGFAGLNVLNGLRELENRGMVAKTLDGGRLHFSIAQPKLREIIYDNLPEEGRRSYHGSVADLMLDAYEGHEDEILEDLAFHYQRSDRVGKALEITIRCGDLMRSIFAHDRAIEHYRHVLRQTQGDPEHRDIWVQTHEKLGDIGTICGDYEQAKQSYSLLLHDDVKSTLAPPDRARILRHVGKLDEIQGEYDASLRYYKQARELLEDVVMSPENLGEKVKTLNSIAWVYVCMGKYEKAMTIAVQALRLIEGIHENIEHAMIFTTIGCANFFKGTLQQAIEYHRRALEICENLENVPEIITSLNRLGEAYFASAEYMEALEHFKQALQTAEAIGDAFGRAMALHNIAHVHLALGEDDKVDVFLRESLKLSRHYRMRYLSNKNYLLSGKLKRRRDELAKAEGDLFRALGTFAKQGNRWGVSQCLLEVAEVHQARGKHDEALKLLKDATENASAIHVAALEARSRLLEVRSLRATRREEGAQLLDRMLVASRLLDGAKDGELIGEIELERGETLVGLRDLDGAKDAFRRAEERFREVADRLPKEQRDTYLALHHVTYPSQEQIAEFREVPGDDSEELPASRIIDQSAPPKRDPGLDHIQEEMLTVASLLQEVGQMGASRPFFEKALHCLVRALEADQGILLSRTGDKLRILGAVDKRTGPLKKAGNYICVEILESLFGSGEPVVARSVLKDAKVASYESLYEKNITSLAIVPLKCDGDTRGAIYLNNPNPTHLTNDAGGPVLQAYQNLLALILPKPAPV